MSPLTSLRRRTRLLGVMEGLRANLAAYSSLLAGDRKPEIEVRTYVDRVNAQDPPMTKTIATAVLALWLLGFIVNMALFAGGPTTASDKVIASVLWPIGLIIYLDRSAP